MIVPSNMFDVRAELLLEAYRVNPDAMSVANEGLFYRGYTHDLLELDEKEGKIMLSRNGLRHFLPEGFLVGEEWLRQAADEEYEMKRRKERLRLLKQSYASFFKAFDTIFFGQEYALHQTIAGLDADGDNVLLEDVFGIRFSGTHNPYIRRLAGLLHQTSVKGNLPMLGFYVRCILGERVSMDVVQKKAVADQPSESYAFVRFVVHIEGLSNEAYNLRMEQYGVFFRLLFRWFLPFDCECDYCIKDRSQRFVLDDAPLTLDYNTQLF